MEKYFWFRFVLDEKQSQPTEATDTQAAILPSCPDLFVFYKKSMIQCTQFDRGQSILNLTKTFQKYLHEYSDKLLLNNLPKIESQTLGSSVQNLTRDFQKISTSGLIQNFSSLLKEGEIIRFTKDEQAKVCCILTTAEYCLETTQQLGEKLKEKIEPSLADQVDLSKEQDNFHKYILVYYFQIWLINMFSFRVISNCIQILVQDLENACEPALTAMSKVIRHYKTITINIKMFWITDTMAKCGYSRWSKSLHNSNNRSPKKHSPNNQGQLGTFAQVFHSVLRKIRKFLHT